VIFIIISALFYICFFICFATGALSVDGFLIITGMYGLLLPCFYELTIEEEEE